MTVNNTLAPAIATLVGADTVSGSVSNKIKNAIEALDTTVTSNDGTFVNVTVTQVDGVVTGVSIAEDNIASASDLVTTNQNIAGETTRATNAEAGLQGAINIEKGRIDTLIGSDSGSIRDIAVDVLTETLVSDSASEAFDTLQEVSA